MDPASLAESIGTHRGSMSFGVSPQLGSVNFTFNTSISGRQYQFMGTGQGQAVSIQDAIDRTEASLRGGDLHIFRSPGESFSCMGVLDLDVIIER